ncbi:MAG: monooxygenase [Flavisolibacter sp.]
MQQQILQINFNFNTSAKEYENIVGPLAKEFSDVPGCQWKIWLLNDEKKEAGGIYLFESKDSMRTFKQSPLVASVLAHPGLNNFSVKEFDIMEEVSMVTRAPLSVEVEV